MTAEETRAFTLLDTYARTKHRCFVAEMDLNKSGAEYILCFRPTDVSRDSPDRFACRYLHIEATRLRAAGETPYLPSSIVLELDKELAAFRKSMSGST